MFDAQKALADIRILTASGSKRNAKYIRNLNRYFFNGFRKDSISAQDTYPMGFWTAANPSQMLADLGTLPSLSIIRSCIETVKSKISQTKPLPNFTPIRGTWKTRKICRQAQIYFDDFFQAQKLYAKGGMVALDAMLMEYGVFWIDDETKSVRRVAPWEFFYDPAEYNFGTLRRCGLVFREYPLRFLKDKLKKNKKTDLLASLDETPGKKCELSIYYNLDEGKQYKFIDAELLEERSIDYDVAPFAMLWYRRPIKGWGSASMADTLMPIQEQVDRIVTSVHEAVELNPANCIFLPQPAGSQNAATGIKKSEFSNQIGNIYPYTFVPGMSANPVTVATPAPIDPMYLQLLETFIEKAYQMEGVSQLSAQSKKPSGLNSGVALDTLENVESERFNSWLQDYIHFFVEVSDICIKVFPASEDILPSKMGRASIKWGDIVKERETFNIQESPVSNLSRDPATKMEQVQKLISMQLIKPSMAASLLEFADLEKAYSVASASYDDCQKIIERAIEEARFDFYEVVDLQQLYAEAANTLMILDADGGDDKAITNLVAFIVELDKKRKAVQAAANPPPPPMVPNPAPQPPPMVQEALPPMAGA